MEKQPAQPTIVKERANSSDEWEVLLGWDETGWVGEGRRWVELVGRYWNDGGINKVINNISNPCVPLGRGFVARAVYRYIHI